MTTPLRMFEIAVAGDYGGEPEEVVVDLPADWAAEHASVEVVVVEDEDAGVVAELVGASGERLLVLATGEPPGLEGGAWSDLDQGWWASIRVVGDDVYIAETDFDALLDAVGEPTAVRPGLVRAGRAEIRWNRVARPVYEAAWQRPRRRGDA